jgi:hypothetical protein
MSYHISYIFHLLRDYDIPQTEEIHNTLTQIFQKQNYEEITDIFVMAFHLRDIRGSTKTGLRKPFYHLMKLLYSLDPSITTKLIPLIPEYGCWRDMWELMRLIPEAEDDILSFVKKTFIADYYKCRSRLPHQMTLLAKWTPREKSKTFPGIAKKLATFLYPSEEYLTRMVRYRRDVSFMNRALQTTVFQMCQNAWNTIEPDRVPRQCLTKHIRAFLNKNGMEDRKECGEKFEAFLREKETWCVVRSAKPDVYEFKKILNDTRYDAVRTVCYRMCRA